MAASTLHLRSEDKPLEHRSALTPATAKALLAAGYTVNVERSRARIFDDDEFAAVGTTLAFSQALLPSLLTLKDGKTTPVWQQAEELFKSKVASLPAELQAKTEEK